MRVTLSLDGIPLFDSGERDHAASAVKVVAAFYAGLTDDEQAQFFEYVAVAFDGMTAVTAAAADRQIYFIGRHLATCECVGARGRAWLRSVVDAMEAHA